MISRLIGILLSLILLPIGIAWAILYFFLARIFPEWGLRVAEKRYERDPDLHGTSERLMWDARHRVSEKRRKRERRDNPDAF
jgi:YD repeat-containing protein